MNYKELISIENLFQAWDEFKKGKRNKMDVQECERNLEDNIFELHRALVNKSYQHSQYEEFYVNDPKRRHIHKAIVIDRIVHHLLYKYLYDLFDQTFIYDSYSCRNGKGTHSAVRRLVSFTQKISKNYTSSCCVLHLDIQKFFANVDHKILFDLLQKKIFDKDVLWLLKEIICSFETEIGKGMPLGNVTSQVFANIYLNELDQFVKHNLKIKYYIRYADDFVIVASGNNMLVGFISNIQTFLTTHLKLTLHPDKTVLRRLPWGVDFLGYIVLPQYIIPRQKTKKRMLRILEMKKNCDNFDHILSSYLGYLSHANTYKLSRSVKKMYRNK